MSAPETFSCFVINAFISFFMLVQNRIFTAEAPRTQRNHFLFGGEPFDRAHGPESIEGIPPNKKVSVLSMQASS
jgi:hypothetical protein